MKKSIIRLILFTVMLLPAAASCEKWLEATSSSQIAAEKLFSTRSGFHEALIGVYLKMGQPAAYGANYTFLVNDLVCCPYSTHNASLIKGFQQNLFGAVLVEPYMEEMWSGGYSIIANINKTLFELERRRDVVPDELEYNLIKGELLAARAYVHFDLMRMFGLDSWVGENADKVTVPYVTQYSSEPTPQKTYAQTAELLVKDINDALECLKDDPVRGKVRDDFEATINADGFWNDRAKRLNYYAVEALLARVHLWRRDYVSAGQMAADVAANALDKGLVKWIDVSAFQQQTEYDYRDWTFSCEHLFSLEITNLYSNLAVYHFPSLVSDAVLVSEGAVQELFMDFSLYGSDADFLHEDVRGPAGLLKYTTSGYQMYKFYSSNGYQEAFRGRMPMIKLPEMYLIQAEAALHAFDYEGALAFVDQVRYHRGVSTPIAEVMPIILPEQSYFGRDQQIASVIFREYLTELLGEGQFLYAVKRFYGEFGRSLFSMNANVINRSAKIGGSTVSIMYPYPVSETTYGRVQEQ